MVEIVSLAIILFHPARMYFQPQRPVVTTLDVKAIGTLPQATGKSLRLVMLAPDGRWEADVEVDRRDPELDLAALFALKDPRRPDTGLWDGRTHHIQLMAGDTPVGSALIVIPLKDQEIVVL